MHYVHLNKSGRARLYVDRMAEGTSRPKSMRGEGNEISSDASRYQSLGSRLIPPPKNPGSLRSSSQRRGEGTGPGTRSATLGVSPKPKRHLPRKVLLNVICSY